MTGNYVYKLDYDNGWKGTTTYLTKDCSWVYCYSKPVTKTIDLALLIFCLISSITTFFAS